MKFKQKKLSKTSLSEKIADALTIKPQADIEDDQVFGTKPQTVSRADFSSSESEDETAISDFRKQNVNLLSDISKKYEGRVVSRKDLEEKSDESSAQSDSENEQNGNFTNNFSEDVDESSSEQSEASNAINKLRLLSQGDDSDDSDSSLKKSCTKTEKLGKVNTKQKATSDSEDNGSDSDGESDDYSITQFKKQLENDDTEESDDIEEDDEDEEEGGYDISQMEEPVKEEFEHVKKQNVSEEAKKGACVRNQLLVWEGLLEMRIHLQRCMGTANQMPLPDTYVKLKNNNQFIEECNVTKENITNVLDK